MGGCFSSPSGKNETNASASRAAGAEAQRTSEQRFQQEAVDAAVALLTGDIQGDASTWVQVFISATSLLRRDILSESDPVAVVYSLDERTGNWIESGRTEVITNTDGPVFVESVTVRYTFDKLQPMRVVFYDVDTAHTTARLLDLGKQEFLGEFGFNLAEAIAAKGSKLTKELERGVAGSGHVLNVRGQGTVRVEQTSQENEDITIQFSASNLANKDAIGKSDPFLKVSRQAEDGSWQPVYKTEAIRNNLNPTWKPITISAQQLCNSEYERPLLLEVFDWDRDGRHDLIGVVTSNALSLKGMAGSARTLELADHGKGNGKAVAGGQLRVERVTVKPRFTFLDYVQGGCQISFMVAIDFTASNGEPHHPTSLHYLHASFQNPYQQAIAAVGEVLQFYDDDRRFPAWGFGGALPKQKVQHCFPLSSQLAVTGVEGIQQAYEKALMKYRLAGPTLFNEVINEAARIAGTASEEQLYHCLLILTDGCIMDMEQTIEAVVKASYAPLSIMLVGIGKATDFRAMRVLDSDQKKLCTKDGQEAMRDIVQFVEFVPGVTEVSTVSRQLLAELPGQLVEYMVAAKERPHAAVSLFGEPSREAYIPDQAPDPVAVGTKI